MRKCLLVMLLAVTASMVAPLTARANTINTYSLSVQNGGLSSAGPWGTVTLTGIGGGSTFSTVTIEFQAASGFHFHNDGIGWNESGTGTITQSVTTCTVFNGATCSPVMPTSGSGTNNFDGFGDFTNWVSGGTGSSSGLTDVIITINGTNLTLGMFEGANAKGASFSALIAPTGGDGCTGYVANAGNSTSGIGTCNPPTATPEPASLVLLGSGFLSLGGLLRRRK